jgi:excisionase family DNA binding protein
MPKLLSGIPFYTVSEVAKAVGVHRITLVRWIDAGKVPDGKRDRNGWRMFSESQVEAIKDFALSTSGPDDVPDEQMLLFHRQGGRPVNASNDA